MSIRKTIRRTLALAVTLGLAVTAPASAYSFQWWGSIPNQQAVQRALTRQVNVQLAAHWHVSPLTWGPGDMTIVVASDQQIRNVCGIGAACHAENQIWIPTHGTWAQPLSSMLSHEVIETEVDRYANSAPNCMGGRLAEVGDYVNQELYWLDGVSVSDFTYPRWFIPGTRGSWDWMHVTTGPLVVDSGLTRLLAC